VKKMPSPEKLLIWNREEIRDMLASVWDEIQREQNDHIAAAARKAGTCGDRCDMCAFYVAMRHGINRAARRFGKGPVRR
jgi:hypothetical protein